MADPVTCKRKGGPIKGNKGKGRAKGRSEERTTKRKGRSEDPSTKCESVITAKYDEPDMFCITETGKLIRDPKMDLDGYKYPIIMCDQGITLARGSKYDLQVVCEFVKDNNEPLEQIMIYKTFRIPPAIPKITVVALMYVNKLSGEDTYRTVLGGAFKELMGILRMARGTISSMLREFRSYKCMANAIFDKSIDDNNRRGFIITDCDSRPINLDEPMTTNDLWFRLYDCTDDSVGVIFRDFILLPSD